MNLSSLSSGQTSAQAVQRPAGGVWARFQCWRGNHDFRNVNKDSAGYGRCWTCARCGHGVGASLVG